MNIRHINKANNIAADKLSRKDATTYAVSIRDIAAVQAEDKDLLLLHSINISL